MILQGLFPKALRETLDLKSIKNDHFVLWQDAYHTHCILTLQSERTYVLGNSKNWWQKKTDFQVTKTKTKYKSAYNKVFSFSHFLVYTQIQIKYLSP